MRILAVSVAPLFPDFVMGGSQRILVDVARALGIVGHDVRVLCTRRTENEGGFDLSPRVRVQADLPLRGTFPAQYQVAPYRLAQTARVLSEAAAWADRVYLHADAIYLRDALVGHRVVRSLHDFVYEEALLSALTLPAALTVVPSEYLKRCIDATLAMARVAPQPLRVVSNGVLVPRKRPAPAPPPGVRPKEPGDIVLLHPHRPDPSKGLADSLGVAAGLARRMPKSRIRLLAPGYPAGGDELDEAAVSREEARGLAQSLGADEILELHDWVPPDLMPSYLAFGDVTLCLGSFIESFGLTPLESAVAGTPAVCVQVGALRELQGVPGVSHIPPGDTAAATEAVIAALQSSFDADAVADTVGARFSHRNMVDGYIDAITHPPDAEPSQAPAGDPDHYALAPWCEVFGQRIYNDYESDYREFPALTDLLLNDGRIAILGSDSLEQVRIEFDDALDGGYLVGA